MKLFLANQMRKLDEMTIQKESISSWNLMERASKQVFDVVVDTFKVDLPVVIFAGPGNNGGDALAVARMLRMTDYRVMVYLVTQGKPLSADCENNKNRLKESDYQAVDDVEKIVIPDDAQIIDGLFGFGLTRPLDGFYADVVTKINCADKTCLLSIDIPSGLFADKSNDEHDIVIKADYTVTFEAPKISFFFPENEGYLGTVLIKSIGLDENAKSSIESDFYYTTKDDLCLKKRRKFDHKGVFGHAFLVSGSYGKMGASVLAATACMRSGVGLLSVHIPKCGNDILQIKIPEAMVINDVCDEVISSIDEDVTRYQAIGIGPGIGQDDRTALAFEQLLRKTQVPMVIDADAINILASHKDWLSLVLHGSIFTPHLKELERLVGKSINSTERIEKVRKFAAHYQVVVVIKGANSVVVDASGVCCFNSTGTPGMATAGSGDVLTGIILGLLAQGYSSLDSAKIGVYLHGLSAELSEQSEESFIASDIIAGLGKTFNRVKFNKDGETKMPF